MYIIRDNTDNSYHIRKDKKQVSRLTGCSRETLRLHQSEQEYEYKKYTIITPKSTEIKSYRGKSAKLNKSSITANKSFNKPIKSNLDIEAMVKRQQEKT